MHLKSIEIHGFKSFAEKASLTFLPPKNGKNSITAVVGPNGSGKSNIADAIRWVMGEQSMKALRGKKSQEIIFSGSAGKGKMGVATVSMLLDNTDHRMPLEYEEVAVSRRIEQTGESEYAVNGNPVRLFDLQVLLAQAQFGHGSYSIIGQGMIDRLLTQSAAERKDFFDEACGIKEFQIKRHQAVLKLARTREHIAEAEMLLNEISPRLKLLSRQVKKLEERQGTELKLRETEERYYVTLWSAEQDSLLRLRAMRASIEHDIAVQQEALRAVQAEADALASGPSRESQFRSLQETARAAQEEKDGCVREQSALAANMRREYASVGQQEIGWMMAAVDAARDEAKKCADALAAAEGAAAERRETLAAADAAFRAAMDRRNARAAALAGIEEALSRAKDDARALPIGEAGALGTILSSPQRFGTVHGIVAELARAKKSDYAAALDIAAGHHISSVVTEDDRVAESWIRHLRDARLGIATFLPKNTIRPRSLPQDIDQLLAKSGVIGLAADLVSFDAQFASIFSFVFGTTLIVESIHAARGVGIGRIRMVTLDGDVLETGGSMKGGYRSRRNSGFSFGAATGAWKTEQAVAEKERALEQSKAELAQASATAEEAERAFHEARRQCDTDDSRGAVLRERAAETARGSRALEDEYRFATADPKQTDALFADMRARHDALAERVAALDAALAGAQSDMDRLHREEDERTRKLLSLQGSARDMQQALGARVEEKNNRQVEIARIETKQEDIVLEAMQALGEHIESVRARGVESVSADAVADLAAEIQKLKYALSLIGGIDAEVMQEYRETRERHEGLSAQLDDLRKALADLETLVAELDEVMKKKRASTFRDIRKEFVRYFSLLFSGGKADIVEVYGEEAAEDEQADEGAAADGGEEAPIEKTTKASKALVGIDVIAQPPGKKIANIQALSGGERTMTSLALLSAILHTNPAPFVVLDEVEAALDEANTVRFGGILQELSEHSQFVIITHNRATMHIADTLYGVTMGGDGMSRLVSIRLPDASS
jgi:chromosome segregation protein